MKPSISLVRVNYTQSSFLYKQSSNSPNLQWQSSNFRNLTRAYSINRESLQQKNNFPLYKQVLASGTLDKSPESRFNFEIWKQIQAGRYKDAERLFGDIILHNQPVNEVTFNNMIVCMLHQNKIPQMETIRTEMDRRRFRVFPKTVSIVLKHFAHEGNVEKATQWFEHLKKNHMPIDEFHISSLLLAYANSGQTAKMIQIFTEWLDNMPLDSVVFSVVLIHLANTKNVEGMQSVLKLAERFNIPITRPTFFAVFISMKALDRFDILTELYKKMPEWNILPDLQTFSSLMNSARNNHIAIKQFWEDMKRCNVLPNVKTLNMMMNSYSKQGDFTGCLNLWNEMKSQIHPDTATLNILITTYAKLHDNTNVIAVFESYFPLYKLPRSEITYLCMIQFYLRFDLVKAFDMLERMELEGLSPTNHPDFVKVYQLFANRYKTKQHISTKLQQIDPLPQPLQTPQPDTAQTVTFTLTEQGELQELK